jgi:hypothetical protein
MPINRRCLAHQSVGRTKSTSALTEVNAGGIPWLRSAPYGEVPIAIWAGTPLSEFIRQIERIGGVVYLPHRPGAL